MTAPISPLIIITDGYMYGVDLKGSVATLIDVDRPKCGYYIIDGPCRGFSIMPEDFGDSVTAWQPATAIPDTILDRLHGAFYNNDMTEEQEEAFLLLESYTI